MTALYAEHGLRLVRLAVIMLGDRATAEDVVQDAFLGLYRRWDSLTDTSHPLAYVRASVMNGCRSALRRRSRGAVGLFTEPPAESAESAEARALVSEEYRAVVAAIRRLPARQREALLLRYYLDMTEDETARAMGVSRGTVKSATSRALAAIGRILKEES
ncbi:SigE family RNA polymerase sigma factor [Trebonia sp.]|uniref:SigE family RNA polymerase sigma factor n=1 Tax=Trebonia sp. TaxID=2767075 RepID=UPI003BAFF0E9